MGWNDGIPGAPQRSRSTHARHYRILYHFESEDGTSWDGRGPPQPWPLAARWEAGENILVLYDPADPARNEPDVFEARNDDLDSLIAAAEGTKCRSRKRSRKQS